MNVLGLISRVISIKTLRLTHPVTHKSQRPPQQSPTSPGSKNPQIATTTTTKTHITGVENSQIATTKSNKLQQTTTTKTHITGI